MNVLDRLAARPAVAADAGLAVVFAVVLAVEGRVIAGHAGHAGQPGAWAFDVAAGAAVCAAALLRSRSRTWAAAAGLAVSAAGELAAWRWHLPGQPGGAMVLALLVLIGAAARVSPVRQAAAVAAGGLVVAAGSLERYLVFIGNGTHSSFAATRIMAVGWVAALAAGLWLRALDTRREATTEAVRRAERLELARELHDTAAHHITGVVLQAQGARISARKGAGPSDEALAGIESAGVEALASMRRVIGLLRDPGDGGGLAPGPEPLTDLVERFAGRGPAVRLRLPDGPADPAWPPEVTTTVCRVVQEALTNVTRHAPGAREVTVVLARDGGTITVEVTDDAPAAGSPRFPHSGGYGLVGMRERVEALGGTLTAGPAAGRGWSVLATLPTPGGS